LQFIDKTGYTATVIRLSAHGTVYTAISILPAILKKKKNKFDVQKCRESIVN
jgi:hypothetical protein